MLENLLSQLDNIDKALTLGLNFNGGPALDWCSVALSSRLVWILPTLLLFLYIFHRRGLLKEAVTVVVAIAATVAVCDQLSATVCKPLFARLRPSYEASLQDALHFVGTYRGGIYGFVSSHAANAFGAVTLVALLLRHRGVTLALIAFAAAVCYSRIYLGVHYVGDIIGGALLGTMVGAATYKLLPEHCKYCFRIPNFRLNFRPAKRATAALVVAVSATTPAHAQASTDSIASPALPDTVKTPLLERITASRAYQMTFIGVPLVVGGLIVKGEDDHFRSLRNDYLPAFSRHLDDYMQYAPGVAMLGMKAFGVPSRSSWPRMLVSDAFSALLMGGVVNTLKQTTGVIRPDGSNNHSFPSGHTATAFMTATMLAKEYGHLSPWVSIGAYSVASVTGLMRMANNKHWLSDVLTGAGIGILTTELGYYLADLIFKDKGLTEFDDNETFSRSDRPSFVSLYLGINIPLSGYDIDDNISFRTSSGSTAGVEGAYFVNQYVGAGGRFTASNTSIIVNEETAENNSFDVVTGCLGAYFSYPLSSRLLVGSKLLGGYAHYPRLNLSDGVSVAARGGFCTGTGLSLTFRAHQHFGVRFFLDYNLQPSHSSHSGEWMNTLTCGASIAATL